MLFGQPIAPGQKYSVPLAISLPAGAASPVLVITEGSAFPTRLIIGDENSFLHKKTVFRLP